MIKTTRIWLPPQTAEIDRVKRRMRPVQIAVLAILALALIVLGISFSYLFEKAPILLATIPLVLYVSFWGTALACLLGSFGALGLLSSRPVLNVPAKLYISLGQGIPVVVTLFLLYFGRPHLHALLLLTSIQAGILGLGIVNGAYLSEVFRVSIQSVHHGQTEAARAIGMTAANAFRRDHSSPGDTQRDSPNRQLLHFHPQGLDVGELHRCSRALFQGAEHWPTGLQGP